MNMDDIDAMSENGARASRTPSRNGSNLNIENNQNTSTPILDNNNSNTSQPRMNDSIVANRRATLRSHTSANRAENPQLSDVETGRSVRDVPPRRRRASTEDVETQTTTSPEVRPTSTPWEQNFQCSICLEIPNDPHATKCGHIFCHACIVHAIAEYHECPMCRTELSSDCHHFLWRLHL